MLEVRKGVSNTLVVTVNEKKTLANPVWLWRFVGDGSNKEVTKILVDTSTYPDRHNDFVFTEGTDITLPDGIHTYYVYEQTSPTNTDYALATTLCEIGQVKVTGTTTQTMSQPTYTTEYNG